MTKMTTEDFNKFLKSKGFIYQSSEIYGGLAGVFDYGHVGTELKKNWMNMWRNFFLNLHENFVEIDASIIMHENVFKASGHLDNFHDAIISVNGNVEAIRADHLIEEKLDMKAEEMTNEEMLKVISENKLLDDIDYSKVSIENFNMMFPVQMGPKGGIKAYLRPETAQSPYVNFKQQFELQRKKLPMGLGSFGRVYRNEIAPRNSVLRTREFEQAELQIFFNPAKIGEHEDFESIEDQTLYVVLQDERDQPIKEVKAKKLLDHGLPKFYVYHMCKVQDFILKELGISVENFRFLELNDKEKAFYNKYHFDVEVKLNNPSSWVELGGVHYRTDHDLKGHQEVSKVSMEIMDEETREKFIPHVLELSLGLGRGTYMVLDQHLDVNENGNTIITFPPKLAPYKVGVFPLMNKPELVSVAKDVHKELLEEDIVAKYDRSGSVGKRYARYDELGTPYCITIDYETIENGENRGTVTIRDRDTAEQKRISLEDAPTIVRNLIRGRTTFEEL